ncbi:MAG: PIG-L family deacetylase [Candidatus Omnitrophica bacterium]|nr:PIG-L family deacetylase [Candidatus Omnitrophota bacterium]
MKSFVWFAGLAFLWLGFGFNGDYVCSEENSFQLQNTDRILIFAPHPDDETIGTGGVIQEAVRLGIPIKVVYLTHGDSNRLSFLTYKKRPILSKTGLQMMGDLRRDEAVAAMKSLGLKEDQLIFLGYPDLGTFRMFTQYWGSREPFTSGFAKVSQVPYPNTYSPRALYVGENVLNDVKSIIVGFRPTKIFTTLLADMNGDHCALSLFLQVALWDLKKTIPLPEVHSYLVHASGWPHPRGFHASAFLTPPIQLQKTLMRWAMFPLTDEQIQKKKDAVLRYKTQISYSRSYLLSFARKNELFGYYDAIHLDQGQPIKPTSVQGKRKKFYLESVTYTREGDDLLVTIRSERLAKDRMKMNLYLLSYRRDIPFSQLPKLRIDIREERIETVWEKRSPISIPHLRMDLNPGEEVVIRLPLARLNHPEYILSSVTAGRINSYREKIPWQVIHVMDN